MLDRLALLGVLFIAGGLIVLGALVAVVNALVRWPLSIVHRFSGRALARLEG